MHNGPVRYTRLHRRLITGALVLVAVYLMANVGFYLVRAYLAYRAELQRVSVDMVERVRATYDSILETAIRTTLVTTDQPGLFRDALLSYDGSYAQRVALLNGLERIRSAVGPVQSSYAMLWPTGEVFSTDTGAFYSRERFYDRRAVELMTSVTGLVAEHDRSLLLHGVQREYVTLVFRVRGPAGTAAVTINLSKALLDRALLAGVAGGAGHSLSIHGDDWSGQPTADSPSDFSAARILTRGVRAVSRSPGFGRIFVLDLESADMAEAFSATASFAATSLLIAGLVFAGFFLLLTRSLRPLDRLLAQVTPMDITDRHTGLADLDAYLTSLMADNEWLQREYRRLLPERRKEFLRDLFTGHVTDAVRLEELLAFNEVTVPESGIVAACLLLDVHDLSEQRRFEAIAVVERVLDDRIRSRERGFSVLVTRDHYGIAVPAPPEPGITALEEPFAALLSDAPEQIRRRMFVGVGDPVTRPTHLVDSYEQALAALEYRRTLGRHVICTATISATEGRRYRYPYERERLLIERIQSGDEEGSLAVLDEMIDQIVADRLGDRELEYLRLQLIHALNRYLYEHELDEAEPVNLYRRYDTTHANTIEEVRAILSDIVRRTIAAQHEHRQASRQALVDRFVEYIRTHCHEQSLQLLDLEEEFGLNRYYIGQRIREYTGRHFNDHVNEARVARAAEILTAEPHAAIKEVASRVGYAYPYYFTRQFKRLRGMTPRAYQASLGEIRDRQ